MTKEYEAIEIIKRRHVHALLHLPNVTSVMVHYKRTNGHETDRLAIRISVLHKRPLKELGPHEVIPKALEGIPTDVYQAEYPRYAAGGQKPKIEPVRLRPLVGGIQIFDMYPTNANVVEGGAGTLGCFVKTNISTERNEPIERVCLLTNYHVVCPGSLLMDYGYEVRQPVLGDTTCGLCKDDPIGRVFRGVYSDDLDAAIVALDPTGEKPVLQYDPQILHYGRYGDAHKLTTSEIDPNANYVVKKYGKTSNDREGTIASGEFAGTYRQERHPDKYNSNGILVKPSDLTKPFQQPGDSGSILLNGANEPIGLLYGLHEVTDANEGMPVGTVCGVACYLEDPPSGAFQGVLSTLDIKILTGSSPQSVPAGNMNGVPHRDTSGNPQTSASARGVVDWADEQLRKSSAGATLANTLWARRHEVVMLVLNDREFRKDWHRYSGPTLIQELRNCLEEPHRPFPERLRHRETTECVQGILSSLRTRASDDLCCDIDRYQDVIRGMGGSDFGSLLRTMEAIV